MYESFKYFCSIVNGKKEEKVFLNGEEITKEECQKILKEYESKNGQHTYLKDQLSCQDECTVTKEEDSRLTNLNIYEVRTALKNMPIGTEAIMKLNRCDKKYTVKLDEDLNLLYDNNMYDDDSNWSPKWQYVFGDNFDDEDVLFATFDIVEEKKEEWVDCDVERAVKMFNSGVDIRSFMSDEYNRYDSSKLIDLKSLYEDISLNAKWQYLKN